MSVRASIYVDDEDAATIAMVRGGIKIEVDGTRVNRYQNEDQIDSIFDWNPEYVGEHVRSDIINFVRALMRIRTGEVGTYECAKADIEAQIAYFLLEPLSDSHLRIAFRTATLEDDTGDLSPAPCAECGREVKTDELSREVLDCGREFLERSAQLGFEPSTPLLDGLSALLDDFENTID